MIIIRPSPEFLVNTLTAGNQWEADGLALPNGRMFIAFDEPGPTADDASQLSVRARILNADGTNFVPEFTVNTVTTNTQAAPRAALLSDGRILVTFLDNSGTAPDTSGFGIRAKILNADGTQSVPEFTVNTTINSTQFNPSIAPLANGRFAIAFTDGSSTDPARSNDVRMRIFNADGSESVPEFIATPTTASIQTEPRLATLQDGRIVMTYVEYGPEIPVFANSPFGYRNMSIYYPDVRAVIFDANGAVSVPDFLVNTATADTQWAQRVTALTDGRFVVTWEDRITEQDVNSTNWGQQVDSEVRAKIFNQDGSQSVADFIVNTTTARVQSGADVQALPGGRFIVTFTDDSQSGRDTSAFAVRAKVFNGDGTAATPEFLVNTSTNGNQFYSDVSVLSDGRILVVFADGGQNPGDTSGLATRAQIFDPTGAATPGDDVAGGGAFGDIMATLGGRDVISGFGGDDTIDGGAGADTIDGGTGSDLIDYSTSSAGVNVDLASAFAQAGGDADGDMLTSFENVVGSAHADMLLGDSSANAITARAGADLLIGGGGADTLDGGAGDDGMLGGTEDDSYFVDSSSDAVVENLNEGIDSVTSRSNFALGANIEHLTLSGNAVQGVGNFLANAITGTSQANYIDGGAGDDTLRGEGGADYMIGGAGADSMDGGDGVDTLDYQASLGGIMINLATNAASGGDAAGDVISTFENVIGSIHNDGLTGNTSANVLVGGAGSDTIDGGDGADQMTGGSGDDTFLVDNAGDQVAENVGEGTDIVLASVSYALTANVENLTLSGAALQGVGNDLVNVITGSSQANFISGGANADVLYGLGGDDIFVVDNSFDVIIENAMDGSDTVLSSVTFVLAANVENLTLQGIGSISGFGNALANTIIGNSGNNYLDGGADADALSGAGGDDTYLVDNSFDVIFENAAEGSDTVLSTVNFVLAANVENLTLEGAASINGYGNALANVIRGNTNANLLDGGAGDDALFGGAGDDTYLVDSSFDVVTENASEGADLVQSSATFILAANIENLTLGGVAAIIGFGNALANVIRGNTNNNYLDGGAGADGLAGGAGDDSYQVDNSFDVIIENALEGTDKVFATVDYALGAELEELYMQGAAVHGIGNAGANIINGNAGVNVINGAGGADVLSGAAGDDIFYFVAGQANGDIVVDFVGNGAAAGDSFVFQGFGGGATLTQDSATVWRITYNGGASVEQFTLANSAAIHVSDYSFT